MIRLEGIEKRYGNFKLATSLDLDVKGGEVFGALGQIAPGKQRPTESSQESCLTLTSGTVFIDGINMSKNPVRYPPQDWLHRDRPFTYEKLTAREFLQFIDGIYGMDRTLIQDRSNPF